ncbi:hypothetical protein VTO42DRAFT_7384 [Malbranchea cinnamomea]
MRLVRELGSNHSFLSLFLSLSLSLSLCRRTLASHSPPPPLSSGCSRFFLWEFPDLSSYLFSPPSPSTLLGNLSGCGPHSFRSFCSLRGADGNLLSLLSSQSVRPDWLSRLIVELVTSRSDIIRCEKKTVQALNEGGNSDLLWPSSSLKMYSICWVGLEQVLYCRNSSSPTTTYSSFIQSSQPRRRLHVG